MKYINSNAGDDLDERINSLRDEIELIIKEAHIALSSECSNYDVESLLNSLRNAEQDLTNLIDSISNYLIGE